MHRFGKKQGRQSIHRTAGQTGLTLVELIIVLLFITLILGLSSFFALGKVLPSARFDATARELSTTLREARMLARINGDSRTVSIDLDTGSYGIKGCKTRVVPEDTGILIRDPFAGEIRHGQYRIVFNSLGGGGNETIVLWSGKKTLSIEPDPIVGTVTIKQ